MYEIDSGSRPAAIFCLPAIVSWRSAGWKPASLRSELLEDWTYQKASILKLVDYMPADKFNFTPPMPPQRLEDRGGGVEVFGKRVLYIAQVNVRFLGLIGGKATPPPEPNETMTSKEASMKAVEQSHG